MKIAILNDFCSRNGGAASVAIDSALGLAEAGHEVRFIGVVGPVDPALTAHAGIKVSCLGQPTFLDDPRRAAAALRGWWSCSAARFVADALQDWRGDSVLLHVHGWVKALSPAIFPELLRYAHWRVVTTLHDYFLACPNGGFMVYPKTEICHRRALGADCLMCSCDARNYAQKLWRFGRGLIQTHGLNLGCRLHGVIGVSQFSLEKLRPYLHQKVLARIVRNPVAVAQNVPTGGCTTGPLLYVGRLSSEKGVALALKAARALGRRIVVVGEGPEAARLGVDYPECEFLGWLSPENVHAQMRKAAALVFPSRWYETNGLVVLEAMANGLPVVVAAGTAATEFVRHGETGRHFKMGDHDSLQKELTVALGPAGASLGRAASVWYWADPWTRAAHVRALESFYTELLA
jgi:glycosyltransferase involved in cell wall biosynthesis